MRGVKNIAIFASGSGSNAENIIKYFLDNKTVLIKCIICNNPKAYVLERAKQLGVPVKMINRKDFKENIDVFLQFLNNESIDFIVLAGFLWLLPEQLINQYQNKIINVHPALLPKYGGKGMYGMNVHEAVIANKEVESGITIHYVNEHYDEGAIIAQFKCKLTDADTPDTLAQKIHNLEFKNFPKVIEQVLLT